MKKIMFNDKYGLTQAVLDGRKTQTRRIVPQSLIDKYEEWYDDVCCIAMPSGSTIETLRDWLLRKHTRYYVGEVVAVAQSYKEVDVFYSAAFNRKHSVHGITIDMLDCVSDEDIKKWFCFRELFAKKASWKNKMFVKAELMPHQIRVTNVRVERLQEISDEDCLKEGVMKWDAGQKDIPFFCYPNSAKCDYDTPQEAFAHLINKVSRKGTWESNPYVFVYDFELVK